jgi:hypothetical protein
MPSSPGSRLSPVDATARVGKAINRTNRLTEPESRSSRPPPAVTRRQNGGGFWVIVASPLAQLRRLSDPAPSTPAVSRNSLTSRHCPVQ